MKRYHSAKKASKKVGRSGFSLIEVLMVMAILAIGILGMMTMQITATKSNANARRITESSYWAADQFEKLISMTYDDAAVAPNTIINRDVGRYTVSYQVSPENTPIPNIKTINVTVTWDAGVQRNISFTYYKADTF